MRFLKDEPLLTIHGKPFEMDPHPIGYTDVWTIGSMVKALLEAHNNQSGLELSVAEYRSYAKLETILEPGPVNGFFTFEDTDYDLLEKMISILSPKAVKTEISRNSPVFVDMLKDATRRKPVELEIESTNNLQEGVEVGKVD